MNISNSNLLRVAISSLLLGESLPFKFRGSSGELLAMTEALMATHALDSEIAREGTTVKEVIDALRRKHRAVTKFEKAFGQKWPL